MVHDRQGTARYRKARSSRARGGACEEASEEAAKEGWGRIAVRALGIALLLAGCATAPPTWLRVDGKAVSDLQFEADRANCRGEMQKSRMASTGQLGLFSGIQAVDDVYAGCMGQRGYVMRLPPQECRKLDDTRMWLPPCQ